MPSTNFTNLVRHLATAAINFETVSLRVMLVESAPTESNLDNWVNRSDVTNEVEGTGYTVGGISQPHTLNALDLTNNRQPITLSNITNGWTSATFNAAGAIIYADSELASTDKLITYVDFGDVVTVSNASFSMSYNSPIFINR